MNLGSYPILAREYLQWLHGQCCFDSHENSSSDDIEVVFNDECQSEPFLSVLMRTQGQRLEELREALLSLQNQDNRDFQLICIGHELSADQIDAVKLIVDGLEEWMQNQTMFLLVRGGTRSTPLNRAFPYVKGRYFSVFDEDDIVYPNWIAAFSSLAKKNPESILYCFVDAQRWGVEIDPGGARRLVTREENLSTTYCHHPKTTELFLVNRCPFMGLAFPTSLIHEMGFRLSERLRVYEDWDFLLRAHNVFPLVSSDERVALYRQWSERGGYSTSVVSHDIWADDSDAIDSALMRIPLLFQPGFAEEIRTGAVKMTAGYHCAQAMNLYPETIEGVIETNQSVPEYDPVSDAFVFDDLGRFGPIRAVRIDPQPHGPLALEDFSLEVVFDNNSAIILGPQSAETNGRFVDDQYEFPGDDPQIVFSLPDYLNVRKVVFKRKIAVAFTESKANSTELFLDVGSGFSSENCITPFFDPRAGGSFVFDDLERFGRLRALRIDPQYHGPLVLEDFSLEVYLPGGRKVVYGPEQAEINGTFTEGRYEFPGDDPQIVFLLKRRLIVERAVFHRRYGR